MSNMDTLVYHDVIGFHNDECDYDFDLEILKDDGPNTRQRTMRRRSSNIYRFSFVFAHKRTIDVHSLEPCPADIDLLHKLCTAWDTDNPETEFEEDGHSISVHAKGRQGVEMSLRLGQQREFIKTKIGPYGLKRFFLAIRAKEFLDQWERIDAINPELNLCKVRDLYVAVGMYVAKLMVDYMDTGKANCVISGHKPMKQEKYFRIMKEIKRDADDFVAAFNEDCRRVISKVKELLGINISLHPNFFRMLLRYLETAPNRFNEPVSTWPASYAFVRGAEVLMRF